MEKGRSKFILILLVVAIVSFIFSLVSLIIHYNEFFEFTGFATDTGIANVTIIARASISFPTESVSWGSGAVDSGKISALLDTYTGNVTDGNWTAVSQALVLQNDGNSNVSVTLTSSKTASQFIGGSTITPSFKLMVSDNETNSCGPSFNEMSSYTIMLGSAQDACLNLSSYNIFDTIKIDVQLRVPSDASPGIKGAVITAIATPI